MPAFVPTILLMGGSFAAGVVWRDQNPSFDRELAEQRVIDLAHKVPVMVRPSPNQQCRSRQITYGVQVKDAIEYIRNFDNGKGGKE